MILKEKAAQIFRNIAINLTSATESAFGKERKYTNLTETMNAFKKFKFQLFKENLSSELEGLPLKPKNISELKLSSGANNSSEQV